VASKASRTAGQTAVFGFGLAVLAVALVSPVGRLADGYLFSAHMLQHLLLVLVVPPLVLLGMGEWEKTARTPGSPRESIRILSLSSWRPWSPDGSPPRVRVPPFVMWALGVGAMWLWHAPTLCDAASRSTLMHRLQEASLLAMGAAFWWPVLSPRVSTRLPPLGGIVYLFTACTACTLLGILITFSPVAVCSVFAHPVDTLGVMPLLRDGWGLTPDRDQQVGGLLMWVPACLVYGVGILAQVARLFHEPAATAARPHPQEVA
jgi:putative membrane protein